jgi:hypothetical protein
MGPWLFLAPAVWMAFVYVMHVSRGPWKAVMGWALLFAPFYLVLGLAEVYARVEDWRKHRKGKG